MRFRKPSLHITILTLFLSFLFLTAGSLTWYNYTKNSEAAIGIADDLLSEVNEQVSGRIENLFTSTTRLANEVSELSYLAAKPDFMSHPGLWFLAESLLAHSHIYSVFIGYLDGDFYQIISLAQDNERLHDLLDAPPEARLAIRRVFDRPLDGKRIELWLFCNAERRIVGSRSVYSSGYDPRKRPWFRKAIGKEGIVKTDFYVFRSTGSMGMTFAHRFDGDVPGVFGVDITLSGLSEYFSEQKVGTSGYVFMFNKSLQVTAHPDPTKILSVVERSIGQDSRRMSLSDIDDPLMRVLTKSLEGWDGGNRKLTLKTNGEKYLVHIDHVESAHMSGQYLAVAAPLSDFTGDMDRTRMRSLLFAAIIIVIAILVAIYNARLMSRPLNRLAKEADKIRHFDLSSTVEVHSHISEIWDLAKAVKAMRTSLASFGRYVPKTLVERLLIEGESPQLGGERREATLFFSDIADFTTISENLEAEELMLGVSEYLQEVGSVILDNGGTIDKYIGDAIMAFWNAPTRQPDHAAMACEAALKAREASEALNVKWQDKGLPVLYTRFGLHLGEPIIGNVGSDDRMNYTAMGASVNLASRLEGLNKYYGTQILVSDAVKERAGDGFVFRPVGKVLPKGTLTPVKIYELVGRAESCRGAFASPEELAAYNELWESGYESFQAQRFADAAAIFEKCLKANPEDSLAATMVERAHEMDASPPGENWDGVDVFTSK